MEGAWLESVSLCTRNRKPLALQMLSVCSSHLPLLTMLIRADGIYSPKNIRRAVCSRASPTIRHSVAAVLGSRFGYHERAANY